MRHVANHLAQRPQLLRIHCLPVPQEDGRFRKDADPGDVEAVDVPRQLREFARAAKVDISEQERRALDNGGHLT